MSMQGALERSKSMSQAEVVQDQWLIQDFPDWGFNLKAWCAKLLFTQFSPKSNRIVDEHISYSSFPVILKVGNVVNFVLLRSEG